jgi:hypothetical protein
MQLNQTQMRNCLNPHNNRIKADAEKRGGATQEGYWRCGLCGALQKSDILIVRIPDTVDLNNLLF